MLAASSDKLPVVEIRPFTHQVWRPAKSYAELQEKEQNHSANTTPRSKAQNIQEKNTFFCPKLKAVPTTRSDYSRAKNRDAVYVCSRPSAFAPRFDREKTTMDDLKRGTGYAQHFTTLQRANSDLGRLPEHRISITGKRLDVGVDWDDDELWAYCAPTRNGDFLTDLYNRMENMNTVYINSDDIYDAFERSATLPSIQVQHIHMKKKKRPRRSSNRSSASDRHPMYQLGVKNSLDVLSHHGPQVKVEQQITDRMKKTISYLRKTKDFLYVQSKGLPISTLSPTKGENSLRSGFISNFNSKSSKSQSDGKRLIPNSSFSISSKPCTARPVTKETTVTPSRQCSGKSVTIEVPRIQESSLSTTNKNITETPETLGNDSLLTKEETTAFLEENIDRAETAPSNTPIMDETDTESDNDSVRNCSTQDEQKEPEETQQSEKLEEVKIDQEEKKITDNRSKTPVEESETEIIDPEDSSLISMEVIIDQTERIDNNQGKDQVETGKESESKPTVGKAANNDDQSLYVTTDEIQLQEKIEIYPDPPTEVSF